jgi:type III secretion protein Q
MTLPFDLPTCSRGFAALTPAASAVGTAAAAAASQALASLVGGEVIVSGRPVPAVSAVGAGAAMLRVELAALPSSAWVEVDARLAAAFLDRLCGGTGEAPMATRLTPLETGALELAALACVDAIASVPAVAERLAPRLLRASGGPQEGLSIELSVRIGDCAGRGRLLLPQDALRALAGPREPGEAAARFPLDLSLRSGAAPLDAEALADLEPGDVVLVDPFPDRRLAAVAPGGLRILGTDANDSLHIEEILMSDLTSEHHVALEVELARVSITLGDLIRLAPDAVLPLGIDRTGSVTLKLGDRTFARGRLVDVEGTIGVRIESMSGERR